MATKESEEFTITEEEFKRAKLGSEACSRANRGIEMILMHCFMGEKAIGEEHARALHALIDIAVAEFKHIYG